MHVAHPVGIANLPSSNLRPALNNELKCLPEVNTPLDVTREQRQSDCNHNTAKRKGTLRKEDVETPSG